MEKKTTVSKRRTKLRAKQPIIVSLVVSLALSGIAFGSFASFRSTQQKRPEEFRDFQIQSFSASSPSKEYVYAGGRLLATEECAPWFSPNSAFFFGGGGTANVSITTPSVCNWGSSSNTSWLHITSVPNGTGNGTVSYSVDQSSFDNPRLGTLTIAGRPFTVVQGIASLAITISPNPVPTYSVGGGPGTLTISTSEPRASWAAVNTVDWITMNTCCGIQNGTVSYTVAPNTTGTGRTATLTFAGTIGPQTIEIKQKGS